MKINEIIEGIAKENNVTVDEVRYEMKIAINAAKDTPYFKAIFGDIVPTIEEFIEYNVAALRSMYSTQNWKKGTNSSNAMNLVP